MKTTWLWIVAPMIAFTSACSDSDSGNANTAEGTPGGVVTSEPDPSTNGDEPDTTGSGGSGNVAALGFLTASYDALDDATGWNAQFLRSPTAFPLSNLDEETLRTTVSDQCSVLETEIPDTDSDFDINLENLPSIELASAGDAIVITSPAGTYATLFSQTFFGTTIYQTTDDEPVAGVIPTGLTIDIPGAAGGFPAFTNTALPHAAPIEFTFDGTTINWTGSGNNNGSVDIIFSALPNGDVFNQTLIECDLMDDGSHTLSSGLLPAGSLEFPLFAGTRTVTLVQQNGDAVLIANAEAEGFLVRN